jgi:PAS domain S-box-containing protein
VQNCSDLIVVLDQRGELVYSNPAAEAMFAFGAADISRPSLMDLVHPDDRDSAAAAFQRDVAEPGAHPASVTRMRTVTGEWRTLVPCGRGRCR